MSGIPEAATAIAEVSIPGGPSISAGAGLRIAFFTDSFEPTYDGVAQVTSTLASALRRRGHEVTVFTVRSPGLPRVEERPNGIRVRRFRSVAAPSYPQYRIALTPWSLPFSRGRFDVVHIHTPGFVGLAGWLAARRWRVPTVGTYHTDLTHLLRGVGRTAPSRAFFRAWSRFSIDLCRHCDRATAPTAAASSDLLGPALSPPRREPLLVPNGVDPALFRPGVRTPDWRSRWGVGEGALHLFLGRLTRAKGVERFLAAVERLDRGRPWLAVIAGEGPLRRPLEQRLGGPAALRGRVQFVGPVLEAEKPALLAQSQVFVIPSLSGTSSVALLEAMAAGVPAVVSSFGGPAEIARRSSVGLIVDPRDPDRLAAAILRLLDDRATARSYSVRGRRWVVEHASAERMAREFEACYRSVLAPRERAGGTGTSGSGAPAPSRIADGPRGEHPGLKPGRANPDAVGPRALGPGADGRPARGRRNAPPARCALPAR